MSLCGITRQVSTSGKSVRKGDTTNPVEVFPAVSDADGTPEGLEER